MMNIRVRDRVDTTPIYQAGLPIELVARERGLDPDTIIKLASNENPLGPSPKAIEAIIREAPHVHLYPDGGAWELTGKLAAIHGLTREHFIIGNGSNEIIEFLGQALLEPGTNVVMGEFPFAVYPLVTYHFGADARKIAMPGLKHDTEAMLAAIDANTRMVCISSPNNPTPLHNSEDELRAMIRAIPENVVLCLDAAYTEYLDEQPDLVPEILANRPLIVLRTFSKVYGLAGLRVGYGMGSPALISLLQRTRQPFNVGVLAQKAALAALDDRAFVERSIRVNRDGLLQVQEGLKRLGLDAVFGQTNFYLVKVPDPAKTCDALLGRGVIVRSVAPSGLKGMMRVSVGTKEENQRFLDALPNCL